MSEMLLAHHGAGRVEFVLQRLVRAGNGGAHALGVVDDGFALGAKPVDEGADASLVLGIGALELVDLGVDEGLELDGARERALDALVHGLKLAATA
jgi:hypothetical protein